MCKYLYFSYYDDKFNCLGFNVIPAIGEPTSEWVTDNVSVTAPEQAKVAVVSLDTMPPSEEPVWIEFYGMEKANG